MLYKCTRCGYENKLKSNFIRHLNRKNICKPKLKNIPIQEVFNLYFPSKKLKNSSHLLNLSSKNLNFPSNSLNICMHCNRSYTRKDNLLRHLKTCKHKKEEKEYNELKKLVNLLNEQLKLEREKFKKEISKKDMQIDKLLKKNGININTFNTTTNIQNNIKILAFNKSDLSHLTDNDFKFCFNRSSLCIPHLVKKIHFNPKKPENHNIYISNIKNNYVMTYDGIKWNLQSRDDVIDEMIVDNECILEDKIEDWINKGHKYPDIMKKFNRYLEKKENDIVKNKIKEEIKLILFNNRKMINNEI